jgi:sugar transferase (PEP-CTERM/EpsH1 system associated)
MECNRAIPKLPSFSSAAENDAEFLAAESEVRDGLTYLEAIAILDDNSHGAEGRALVSMKKEELRDTVDRRPASNFRAGVLAGDERLSTCGNEESIEQPAELRGQLASGALQPLRVLHVVNRLGMGGTEYGVLKVIRGLSTPLFEHRICATRGYEKDVVQREHLLDKLSVASDKERGFQFLVPRLARIIRKYQPHVVHSRNWGAIEAVVAARLACVPVAIHSEHGYEIEMLHGLSRKKRWIRRAVYAMCDCVFTVSEQLREYHALQAGVSQESISVIPNGVDTIKFAPRWEKRSELRQKFGLPVGSLVLGSVGRLVAIKGQNVLLAAAGLLLKRGADLQVVLAGSGPELEPLKKIAETSPELRGRVTFLGSCDEIPDVLNALDVFVLPSLSEGMSNTLLEALASGVPVIATRVGGNPEVVEHGQTGLLCPSGDVTALADCIDQLLSNLELRGQLGAAGRRSALVRFSLQRMIMTYQDLYLKLVRNKREGLEAQYPCAA